MNHSKAMRKTPKERLKEYVIKDKSGCWFMRGRSRNKYNSFYLNGKGVAAHRATYILFIGEIPKGEGHHGVCVLHSCDTPACINPKHLRLGTMKENIAERDAKGRQNNWSAYSISRKVVTEELNKYKCGKHKRLLKLLEQ